MTDDFCDHCDLPKSQCIHGLPPKIEVGPIKDGPTIEATQETPCPACPRRIEVGDSITHSDEGWVHTSDLDSRSWSGEVQAPYVPSKPPETDASMFDGIE